MQKTASRPAPIEGKDEVEALLQSQTDPQAFKPIYQKYFKRIFLFVLHRVGDRATASDITQQVFLKALAGLRKFQFRGLPFSAWLYRIAINECNDFFRQSKKIRVVTIEEADVNHLYEELTQDITVEQLHQKLPHILQKLDPQELYFLELRFFENHSFREVGEILGLSEVNAKVKTYRILDKMKKLFLS
jgi:RNA polymerase sigma-70 factor (ECF subfamily)